MENEYILHHPEDPVSLSDAGLSESTEIEKKICDMPLSSEMFWWQEIKEIIFPGKSMKETTFFKIFFSIPFYIHKIDTKSPKYRRQLQNTQIYENLKEQMRRNAVLKGKKKENPLAKAILDCVGTYFEKLLEDLDVDIKRAVGYTNNYNNHDLKRFVYKEYNEHSDFYTEFLKSVFHTLAYERTEAENSSLKISEEIFSLTHHSINRKAQEPILNLSLYLYFFILLKTNDNNKVFPSDIIDRRLRNPNSEAVQEDLFEYASIIEQYPVNTLERLGALHQAARQRNGRTNLYAVSELYFLYRYGAVLSNICGDKRYILKKNTEKADSLYKILLSEANGFLPVILNHDGLDNTIFDEQDDDLFIPKLMKDYRDQYATYNLSQKKNMIDILIGLYKNPKGTPVNLELMFFLEEIKADQFQATPDCFDIVNEVRDYWYSQFTGHQDDESFGILFSTEKSNDISVHKILYALFQKLPEISQNSDLLKQLCRAYSSDELKKSMEAAQQNALYYFRKNIDNNNNEYFEEEMRWRNVLSWIKKLSKAE